MAVRAKFVVESITDTVWGHKQVVLGPRYDQTIPEDQRFSEATPSGKLEMMVRNPAVLEELQLGRAYYLDLTPA